MTTSNTLQAAQKTPPRFRLPDIPEKHPDDMTSSKHLSQNGNMHFLLMHLGRQNTTIVSGERYICKAPRGELRYPDLLVSFNADPALYEDNNGYIISEQGKPPDFVLEIASRHTGHVDIGVKRDYYEDLGIAEYWRFDETGEFHGERLACDLLVDGRYQAAVIEELEGGGLQGYSPVLNLYLRWDDGQLVFLDPDTGEPIATMETERDARILAEMQAEQERRNAEQARARTERAEARIQELENKLRSGQS